MRAKIRLENVIKKTILALAATASAWSVIPTRYVGTRYMNIYSKDFRDYGQFICDSDFPFNFN